MVLRTDELNILKDKLYLYKDNLDKILELMTDWLLLAFADGKTDVEQMLGREADIPLEDIEDIIYADVGDKDPETRTREYFYIDDFEAILKAWRNDRQRVYNNAAFETAKKLGAVEKTWHCMMLPQSRDTHIYLNDTTKGIDEFFDTYNGNSALYPMGFDEPEEDINCMCWLTFK